MLFIGDEDGVMRVFDISELLKKPYIVPVVINNLQMRLKLAYKVADINGKVNIN